MSHGYDPDNQHMRSTGQTAPAVEIWSKTDQKCEINYGTFVPFVKWAVNVWVKITIEIDLARDWQTETSCPFCLRLNLGAGRL